MKCCPRCLVGAERNISLVADGLKRGMLISSVLLANEISSRPLRGSRQNIAIDLLITQDDRNRISDRFADL